MESAAVIHFGKVLEDVVRKEFIQRTGLMVRKKNSILRSKEYPFMIADLDGVVSEFDGTYSIFEAKTAIEFKNNDWKNGEIPKAYQLQVQHYLAVTGFQKAYIAVLVGGNKFYWTEIYRDEQLIKMLVSMESHFWHCVKTGEEPDVDASKATSLYLGAKYSNPKVGSIIDFQLKNMGLSAPQTGGRLLNSMIIDGYGISRIGKGVAQSFTGGSGAFGKAASDADGAETGGAATAGGAAAGCLA